MFEGNEKCAICNCGLVHGKTRMRADVDGVTHAFCSSCAEKKEDVHRRLGLKH